MSRPSGTDSSYRGVACWLLVVLASAASAPAGARPAHSPSTASIERLQDKTSPGKHVRLERRGKGKTVVFCHGYGGSPTDSVLPELLKRWRRQGRSLEVFAPFIEPKRGSLAHPERGYRKLAPTTVDFALAQIETTAEAVPGKVTLIGHSFGGLSALLYAAAHPDKVERLVLLAPALGTVSALKRELGIRVRGSAQTRRALSRALGRMARALEDPAKGSRRARAALKEELAFDTLVLDIAEHGEAAALRRLKVPTLVLRADGDELIARHRVNRVKQAQPRRVKLVGIPGADHMFDGPTPRAGRENLDRVAQEIARFLSLGMASR